MLKYLFMGSPAIAARILQTLCEKSRPPEAVVTQLPKPAGRGKKVVATEVETYARSQELNVFATENVNDQAMISVLHTFKPDVILVAAFGQIFREGILALPTQYCLNVHASLLPAYRGAAPIQWAIWNGETRTGITIQKMVKRLDAGDILVQKSMEIGKDDTSVDLLARLAQLGGECLWESLNLIETNQARFTPQDEKLATYAPKIEKTHAIIDWSRPAEAIRNQIRALQPWPIAESVVGNDRVKIFGAEVVSVPSPSTPGKVVTDSKTFLRVVCGDGRGLSLTEIQLENRKRLSIQDFLMAYRGSFPHTDMGALP